MKAIRLHAHGGPEQLVYEDAPQPQPAEGEVLVRVYAAGVSSQELTWSTTWQTAAGAERRLPIPSHEVSGVVVGAGRRVAGVATGAEVYGLTDFRRDGAEAEYCIALPAELSLKPHAVDHVRAAAIPIGALTAWQALFDHAHLSAGQTVLIHGAAGGVGTFAVQLSHWAGARVVGTASARNREFLHDLGADQVIDYTATRFEDVIRDVDVVLDAVGGDTLDRSWPVLKKGGILVSVAQVPSQKQAAAYGVRAAFFIVQPSRDQLMRIGDLIDAERVRPVVAQIFPLSEARQAYELGLGGHTRGKLILRVVA